MANGSKEKPPQEGPRSFARFIEQLDDGAAHSELSEALQGLAAKMADEAYHTNQAVSGELVFALRIKVNPRGAGGIAYDIKVKEPKKKHAATYMWLTPGNNVTFEKPNQLKLPLREAPRPEDAPDVQIDDAETRAV